MEGRSKCDWSAAAEAADNDAHRQTHRHTEVKTVYPPFHSVHLADIIIIKIGLMSNFNTSIEPPFRFLTELN